MSGILAFSFFLIPGISGSAMLVVLGVYGPVIQAVAMLDFGLLIPFAMGCLISLLLLPKAILSIYSSHEQNLMHIFSGLIMACPINSSEIKLLIKSQKVYQKAKDDRNSAVWEDFLLLYHMSNDAYTGFVWSKKCHVPLRHGRSKSGTTHLKEHTGSKKCTDEKLLYKQQKNN